MDWRIPENFLMHHWLPNFFFEMDGSRNTSSHLAIRNFMVILGRSHGSANCFSRIAQSSKGT
eukprot:12831555-Alexandrium_andersonii.AAC.1